MEKPCQGKRDLKDWDSQLTSDWMEYAQTAQTGHCRNINANETGGRYTADLFHKIDELVLVHAFGAAAVSNAPSSDIKKNFSRAQCNAAENIRNAILKFGKTANPKDPGSTVTVQVISVTIMLVECPGAPATEEKTIPGLAQVAVFRVLKPDKKFCFIDHTARYYADWNDYLSNNALPRSKMCFPRDGIYKFKRAPAGSTDENNNNPWFTLDLALAESNACTTLQRAKNWTLNVVSKVGAVAGLVAIVAAPFTGGTSLGVYAGYAAAVAGWVSFGCMVIGTMATMGSLWDKYWHDESYTTELLSLAMVVLHYGVARYNASVLKSVKDGAPITRTQLAFLTVVNCFRFGVDSIMFVMNSVRLVMKACDVGITNIAAEEWLHFAMSAYLFSKTVFEPKTGYGIIKQAQERYLMDEKRVQITDEKAQETYDKLVDKDNRFGEGGKVQTVKDDWKGATCSQEVCDELNKNGTLIRNVNSITDLNQFFLNVNDAHVNLRVTADGNISLNGSAGMSGNMAETLVKHSSTFTARRGRLLGGSSTCTTQTATTTECITSDPAQPDNASAPTTKPASQSSGFGSMTVGEMRARSAATTTPTVSKTAPTKTKADVSTGQSATSTATQVSSTLWATIGLAKRPKTCPGTTTKQDSKTKCICQSVKIPVLYVNMQSINPENDDLDDKLARLRTLVQTHHPQLIAIVETWLRTGHTTEKVLRALQLGADYEVFRHDRDDGQHPGSVHSESGSALQGRRGGGVLVLWRRNTFSNISCKHMPDEDYADNIFNVDVTWNFRCTKCHPGETVKKFAFVLVYRRPAPSNEKERKEFKKVDDEVVEQLVHLNMTYDDPLVRYSGIAMVGDFNWRETAPKDMERLTYVTYGSNCQRMPLSMLATHEKGGALDQVYSSPWFVVNSKDETLPTVDVSDFVSDHAALLFSLRLGKDSKPNEQCQSLRCF